MTKFYHYIASHIPVGKKTIATLAALALFVAACSGGTEGTGENQNKIRVRGVVEAPGGALAFTEPDPWQKLFDGLLGTSAYAAIEGIAPVGAGVTVNLIQVDSNGNQVGDVIASTETDANGKYAIPTIESFSPDSQYLVRALGSNGNMDSRVAETTVNVNPISDAASNLISKNVTNLSDITPLELQEIEDSVDRISKNIDPSGLTAKELSNEMQAEAEQENESSNIINSSASHGLICGTVTGPTGNPLPNVRIIARDYGNWVTRAASKTIADGSYCLNVPIVGDTDPDTGKLFDGRYILGALNRNTVATDPQYAASEWWTAAGDGYSQFVAEEIRVSDENRVEKNFNLASGGRISGKITDAAFGAPIEGITVVIRTFNSFAPVASARSGEDGSYAVNLIPGSYFVETRNTTAQAFASEVYDGLSGSNASTHGIPVAIQSGQNQSIDFALSQGRQLSGVISDGVGSTPVTGQRVMVNLTSGGPSLRLRSNKIGAYNVWLKPDNYTVYAYGQVKNVSLATSVVANFDSDQVSKISAQVLHNNNPVSQAKVRLNTSSGAFINMEPSSSDGSVTIYSESIGDFLIEARIDGPANYGTIIYDNQRRLFSGTLVSISAAASTIDIGNIVLPDGGILTGKFSNANSAQVNRKVFVYSSPSAGQAATSGDVFTFVRTRGDGSYLISLPAGSYDRVGFGDFNSACHSIVIDAGKTTTLNYDPASGCVLP